MAHLHISGPDSRGSILREAYLSGQPALPKYLDSGRRKRVSIFGRVMDLDESQKALGRIVVRAEEWGKNYSGRGFYRCLFFTLRVFTPRGYTP